MEIYNQAILVGNLGRDPEIRTFDSGTVMASFSIAVWQGQEKPSTWVDVKAFKGVADAASLLRKVDRIRITGKLAHDEWNDKATGAKRTKMYVVAFDIEKIERDGPSPRGTPVALANETPDVDYDDIAF